MKNIKTFLNFGFMDFTCIYICMYNNHVTTYLKINFTFLLNTLYFTTYTASWVEFRIEKQIKTAFKHLQIRS